MKHISVNRCILFFAIAAIPIVLFILYANFVVCNTPAWRANLGTFGDSFGALNTLFTGVTFAGLLITIFQQREEISNQHRELVESRVQFERSASAQEATARFNAFYELLSEYSLQLHVLDEMKSAERINRLNNLSDGDTLGKMHAADKPSQYESEIVTITEKKKKIIAELEVFLAKTRLIYHESQQSSSSESVSQ